MRKRSLVLLMCLCSVASVAWGGGVAALAQFLSRVQSGDVTFTQTVTAPNTATAQQTLTGRMRFVRPDRFRFDYQAPYRQEIVADGQAVWLYDIDLLQVTVSDQKRTLAASPAGLLLAARDVATLREAFVLSDLPDAQGLQWVSARPKQKDATIAEAQLAFDQQGLVRLEMLDAFGQRSAFRFEQAGMGRSVDVSAFRFSPPEGADVIDQRMK